MLILPFESIISDNKKVNSRRWQVFYTLLLAALLFLSSTFVFVISTGAISTCDVEPLKKSLKLLSLKVYNSPVAIPIMKVDLTILKQWKLDCV